MASATITFFSENTGFLLRNKKWVRAWLADMIIKEGHSWVIQANFPGMGNPNFELL